MRSVFNPTRRNRNIGTAKQGYGQSNRLTIPNVSCVGSYLERIGEHETLLRDVKGRQIKFLIEATRRDCGHHCTVDDIAQILEFLPTSDWSGIDTIFFRQPTRKQAILSPTWGRLKYYAEIRTFSGRMVASGPIIYIDAVERDYSYEWTNSLSPENQIELRCLKSDGHEIDRQGGKFIIQTSETSIRNTQLYRTLPHEIGHWFDWLQKVETPFMHGEDYSTLVNRYFNRPQNEREAFAHRYASDTSDKLKQEKLIPFDRRV